MLFFKKKAFSSINVAPTITIKDYSPLLFIDMCIKSRRVARIQCVLGSDNSILISDIIHNAHEYNKGYGSHMMETLLTYAKQHGYTRIYGNLSTVDSDHLDRLLHFYKKFGFAITIFDKVRDCYFGEIHKDIFPEKHDA